MPVRRNRTKPKDYPLVEVPAREVFLDRRSERIFLRAFLPRLLVLGAGSTVLVLFFAIGNLLPGLFPPYRRTARWVKQKNCIAGPKTNLSSRRQLRLRAGVVGRDAV
jgi:hypothetical protein